MTLDDYLVKFRSTIVCHASWKNPERQTPHERLTITHTFQPSQNGPAYLEQFSASTVCYRFDLPANVDI